MIQTLPQHQMCGSARTVITQRVGLVQLVFLETKRVMDKKKTGVSPGLFLLLKQQSEVCYRIFLSREPKVEILKLSYHFDSRLVVETKNLGHVVNDLFVDRLIDAVDDCL